ncbi:hypothetical protein CHUAL_009550 [Chamberlinius hualienensis]
MNPGPNDIEKPFQTGGAVSRSPKSGDNNQQRSLTEGFSSSDKFKQLVISQCGIINREMTEMEGCLSSKIETLEQENCVLRSEIMQLKTTDNLQDKSFQ